MAMTPSIADDAQPLVVRTFGEPRYHTDGDLLALAYDAAGTLWSVEEPGTLRSWDEAGRTTRRTDLLDIDTPWYFSPDATRLAAACDELMLWDVATGKKTHSIEVPSWVTAVAFHPVSQRIATGHDDGFIRLWDPGVDDPVAEFGPHSLPVSAVAFAPDGARLASAGEDRVIKIWDLASAQELSELVGHTDRIPAVAWQKGTNALVSIGWDTTARVWDVATGQPRILLNTHDDQVLALAFSPDGSLLATADSASTVYLWSDLSDAKTRHTLPGFSEEIRALAFTPDANRLAVGGTDRVIHVYDTATGAMVGGRAADHRHAIARWGDQLVSTAGDSGIQVFRPDGTTVPNPFPPGRYAHVAVSPNGRWVAATGPELFIQLWDTRSGELRTVDGPKSAPGHLAFSPDNSILSGAIAGEGTVWLWSLETFEPVLLVIEATEGCTVESHAWHPNGRWLLCGGIDFLSTSGATGAVCLWDVPEKKRLVSIPMGAHGVAFDRDARRFAIGGPDGWVAIHSTEDGVPLLELVDDSREPINAVAFSPDGAFLLAGGDDGVVRSWDAESAEFISARRFRSTIDDIVVGPDGTVLVAHENGTISELPLRGLTDE
jgi:WD40 repeat protein